MLRATTLMAATAPLRRLVPSLTTRAFAGAVGVSEGAAGAEDGAGGATQVANIPTIGIDLGTTNSCVAVVENGEPRVLENEEGKRTTPSVVAFQPDGSRLVGAPAKRGAVTNPKNTIYGAKRLIGRTFDDPAIATLQKMVSYEICRAPNGTDAWVSAQGKQYSPSQIGSFVLTKMQETAARVLGGMPNKAVITVPAYFDDSQRQATKDAGRICGFDQIRIINEPTAAALSYGINSTEAQTIAVYDLGGGTFDISVLEVDDGVFVVKSTGGDSTLGGEDWDETILQHMLSTFKSQTGVDLSGDQMSIQRLREAAEEAKRALDASPSTDINLPFITQTDGGPLHFEATLTRAELEKLTGPLIDKTRAPSEQALRDAHISAAEVDKVLLVGGMTRMPKVVSTVAELFGKDPSKGVNPDEAVASGAAIQGSILDGAISGVALVDVTPLSLGTNVEGGLFARIIERNTPIPVSKTKTFTTAQDHQTYIVADVLQGDRELAAENRKLGTLRLDGIPPMRKGVPQLDVTFDLNAEGILKVTATDQATGTTSETVVETKGGLTEAEIEQMVREAEMFAEEDKKRRAAIELRNEAESLAHTTRASVEDNAKLLTEASKTKLLSQVDALEAALDGKDGDALRAKMDELKNEVNDAFEAAYKSKQGPAAGTPPPEQQTPQQ
ncbi:heat shock protein 70 [Thecamonas trahens ATCC 50062]|uniref:Heat shock protein 70 n=1 Tax=Thecamonas trahens ATCC 50062 TaxID=461836 RepID=A0A0L0D8I3_THETB|nr:heat shock protein 70 [Thecamonas trahens ATCC 50062]KNC48682.1 heat shock protein 70 [Thecamonas trahens ATCC 50062]|eukprot:XP_013762738.1 heat shock protein 70 [Thecamonas trahens ATCC 50062]